MLVNFVLMVGTLSIISVYSVVSLSCLFQTVFLLWVCLEIVAGIDIFEVG